MQQNCSTQKLHPLCNVLSLAVWYWLTDWLTTHTPVLSGTGDVGTLSLYSLTVKLPYAIQCEERCDKDLVYGTFCHQVREACVSARGHTHTHTLSLSLCGQKYRMTSCHQWIINSTDHISLQPLLLNVEELGYAIMRNAITQLRNYAVLGGACD